MTWGVWCENEDLSKAGIVGWLDADTPAEALKAGGWCFVQHTDLKDCNIAAVYPVIDGYKDFADVPMFRLGDNEEEYIRRLDAWHTNRVDTCVKARQEFRLSMLEHAGVNLMR